MGYYDSVKDSIRDDNNGSKDEGDNMNSGSGNFDTLKQNAEESSEKEDENKGDDTPIEVLEEDGLKREAPSQNNSNDSQTSSTSQGNPLTSQDSNNADSSGSADMSSVEDKLDKIIDQNQRMIEILESFGQ